MRAGLRSGVSRRSAISHTTSAINPIGRLNQNTNRVSIGDAAPQTFRGTHSMGDPAFVLPAWLRHATRDGDAASAGTVVTTGTWCGLPLAAAGDRVVAEFAGIGRAVVQL